MINFLSFPHRFLLRADQGFLWIIQDWIISHKSWSILLWPRRGDNNNMVCAWVKSNVSCVAGAGIFQFLDLESKNSRRFAGLPAWSGNSGSAKLKSHWGDANLFKTPPPPLVKLPRLPLELQPKAVRRCFWGVVKLPQLEILGSSYLWLTQSDRCVWCLIHGIPRMPS